MKKFKTIILPIIIGLVAAILVIWLISSLTTGARSAVEAAASYLKASMLLDADEMVKNASDYTKATLNGGTLSSDKELKEKLNSLYRDAENTYKGKEIKFKITEEREIDMRSEEGAQFIARYSSHADSSVITKIALIGITTYCEGNYVQKSNCYCVMIGGRWYFGYQY